VRHRRRNVCSLALTLMLVSTACHVTQAPIESPRTEVGLSSQGQPHRMEEIADAVRRGLLKKGWNILQDVPGVIDARVETGGHHATVRITYTTGGWLIEHVDSSPGLRYEQHRHHGPIIHHRYNSWARKLDAAIRDALLTKPQDEPGTDPLLSAPASEPQQGWDEPAKQP
jgi:hypothetical protein